MNNTDQQKLGKTLGSIVGDLRSLMSRLLGEAKAAEWIKEDAAKVGRYVTYVPIWA